MSSFFEILEIVRRLENALLHEHPAQIGAALVDLKMHYEKSNIVIFRCNCNIDPFYLTLDELEDTEDCAECEFCGQPCDRLLITGEWQTQAERDRENQAQYERVSG